MTKKKNKKKFYENSYVSVEEDKFLTIDYGSILGNDNIIEGFGTYHLKKRTFYGISNMIVDTVSRFIDECHINLVLNYIDVTFKIRKPEGNLTEEELSVLICNKILNPVVKQAIDKYVEDNYKHDLDAESKDSSKKINMELLFTDNHVKSLLKISESMRLTIPLITEYINLYNKEVDDVLYTVFVDIMELFQEDGVNMNNKLHKFIDSRISATSYSDKTMWREHKNRSKNCDIVTAEFYENIITGILPKSDINQKLVNYLDVVTRQKLTYSFYNKFDVALNPVNLNQVDSDGLTLFDKFEINMVKKDESKLILNNLTIDHQIKNLLIIHEYDFSVEEFDYYKKNIMVNNLQTQLIFLYYSKYMNGYENIYTASKDNYILMLMILRRWLEENGYTTLARYLIALPNRRERRITIDKQNLATEILSSKIFERLQNSKYKYSAVDIMESGTILKLVGNLSISKFTELIPYHKNDQPLTKIKGNEISMDVDNLTTEILNFIELI